MTPLRAFANIIVRQNHVTDLRRLRERHKSRFVFSTRRCLRSLIDGHGRAELDRKQISDDTTSAKGIWSSVFDTATAGGFQWRRLTKGASCFVPANVCGGIWLRESGFRLNSAAIRDTIPASNPPWQIGPPVANAKYRTIRGALIADNAALEALSGLRQG
jgi:hypothetical protein